MGSLQNRRATHLAIAAALWLVTQTTGSAGFIRGTVSADGKPPIHSLRVAVHLKDPVTLIYGWVKEVATDASTGTYQVDGLVDGVYRVLVFDYEGNYAMGLYEDSYVHTDATPVVVTNGMPEIDPVNLQVEKGSKITGRVQREDVGELAPLQGITVTIEEVTDTESMQLTGAYVGVQTDAQGYYAIGLRPGIYVVGFWDYSPQPQWATQIFSNVVANEWATPIVLTNTGHERIGVDAVMQPGFVVSGVVSGPSGQTIQNVAVSTEVLRPETGEWGTVGSEGTDISGGFSINLPPGTYRMNFQDDSLLFEHEFWNDQTSNADANAIEVTASDIGDINVQLDYTPLARWAFSYGLDPFADVERWRDEDPDLDGFNNFHEFAFGTDPTDAKSGYPIRVGPSPEAENAVALSALFHQNVSTAYRLDYELLQKTDLASSSWVVTPIALPLVPASDPLTYIELSTNVPTTPDPCQFFRLRATINPN